MRKTLLHFLQLKSFILKVIFKCNFAMKLLFGNKKIDEKHLNNECIFCINIIKYKEPRERRTTCVVGAAYQI